MTIQKIIAKSEKSLKPTQQVINFNDIYIIQAKVDLLDTLKEKQRLLDLKFPGAGSGVGLASNQIDYPHEPVSETDETPKQGFYPKNFIPPNMYVVSIRKERANLEKCHAVEPTVFINAEFKPITSFTGQEFIVKSFEEGCLSVSGFVGLSVPRFENIKISADNSQGNKISLIADGFIARVHQHEIDHGHGKEYLNQLQFTHAELKRISHWIDTHENKFTEESEWVIKNKLKCISPNPDYAALRAWVDHELINMNEIKPLSSKKILILGATVTALGLFALHKICKTSETSMASTVETGMKILSR